jgi:hypothetical protein
MKKCVWVLAAIMVASVFAFSMANAESTKRYDASTKTCRKLDPDDVLRGYKLFKEFCKECHNRKNSQAKFLYNESNTPKAWDRVFFAKYPKCAKDGSWNNLHLDDQLVLNDYLYNTGADTHAPNGCG